MGAPAAALFSAVIGALASVVVALIANHRKVEKRDINPRIQELERTLDEMRDAWDAERREWQHERTKLMVRLERTEHTANESVAASRACQEREMGLWKRIAEQDATIARQNVTIEQLRLDMGR